MEPRCLRWSSSSDLDIGTLVAVLPDVWPDMVIARTGWPGISVP